jgi:hypothetical protein
MGELSIGAATPEGLEAVFTTAPPAGKISHGPWVALSFLRRTLFIKLSLASDYP